MAIKHLCVVSRGDQVLTYNNSNKKYSIFNCPEGTGASMGALQTIATILENISDEELGKMIALTMSTDSYYKVIDWDKIEKELKNKRGLVYGRIVRSGY